MALSTFQKFKINKFLKEVGSFKARHTELVTVYIPSGYDINKIINHLSQEQGTAKNIKSASTRNNVIDALEKMIQHLRLYKQTPPNGLAVFSGNVAEREGQSDVKVWSLEPPVPLKTRIYRCDKDFQLDLLYDLTETKEVYGLVVMDARDSDIAILKGKAIIPLTNTHSHVPGKMKAGGQCIGEDTLLMCDDGELVEIKKSHNPLKLVSANIPAQNTKISRITGKWENKKELFKIITKYPRISLSASKDHVFFVRTTRGIEEKPLSNLKKGDYLIMPEKINLNVKNQKINFKPELFRESQTKKVKIPRALTKDFARLLGYYLGDGSYEHDRLTFFEQRKDVAEVYENLIKKVFNIDSKLLFRKDKNYYQLRVYSRIITQLFLHIFPNKNKTLEEKIPSIILKSTDDCLAAFINGFFDAEGYISSKRVALGINNPKITQQLQFALLRLGIISSINEYSNKKNQYSNKTRYTLSIEDKESIGLFSKKIGFSSKEKTSKLKQAIKDRKNKSYVRNIFVNGLEVNKLLKEYKEKISTYRLSGFLNNKRQLNKKLFKEKFINTCKNPELKNKLLTFLKSRFIPVKISKIESLGIRKTYDIETSSHNFFANGILVHNSAKRFQANRDLAVKAHMKKTAEMMKEQFLTRGELKGIIVGGPGPVKQELVESSFITGDVKKKILGIKDLSYTGEFGLQELLDRSQDLLANEEVADEKKIMTKFLESLSKNTNSVAYGEKDVIKAIEMGAVETVLLSIILDDEQIEKIEELAKQFNTEVKIISTDTREGVQLRDIGKYGAILRYEIEL